MSFIALAALVLAIFYFFVWVRRLYFRRPEALIVSPPDPWAETVPMEATKP